MTPTQADREEALAAYTDRLLAELSLPPPPPRPKPNATAWPFDEADADEAATVQLLARVVHPQAGPAPAFRQRLGTDLEHAFVERFPSSRAEVVPFFRRPIARLVAALLAVVLVGALLSVFGEAFSAEAGLGTALGDSFGILLVSVVGLVAVIGFFLWQRHH